MTRFYRKDPVTGGLADVIVYLKRGLENRPYEQPSRSFVALQVRGCEFVPYVLSVQTGQEILLVNSDPVAHGVHFMPRASGNRESTYPLLPNNRTARISFDQLELFLTARCDSHPWMFGYIGVFDHPYHAVTDKDGTFQIPYVPYGTYTIEAVHRKAGQVTRDLTVIGTGEVTLEFSLDVPSTGS